MTQFEQFAKELDVKITVDKSGRYDGMCKALADMTDDIILSDDDTIFNLSWEEQKALIKERFYIVFPYMKKAKSKNKPTRTARQEAYIDRIFRGYGETRFGKKAMDTVTSSEVELARCNAMRALGVLTEEFGQQPHGTAENLFCGYIACLLKEKEEQINA